jgi:tetratricopeptide (TPR) repeat protein
VPFDDLLISADFRSVDPLVAYFESASFVHFLIDSIGVVEFHDLYDRSTDLSIKPAFLAATGRTIKQWERMWRDYIAAREFKYPELVYHAHRAQAIMRELEHIQYLELAIADLGDSVSVPLIQELATAYYSTGRYGDAYVQYKRLVASDTASAQYRQYCGNIAAVLGRLDEAWDYFEKAVELDTVYSAPFLSMGDIMVLRGRPDSAVALWEIGLDRGESIPLYTELLIRLARHDRRMRRTAESMDRLTMAYNSTARLLGDYPDHPRYLSRMGDVLTEMLQPDSAMVYYQAAEFFEGRPYYLANVYLGIGKAYDLAGDRTKAVEYYEKVFDIAAAYGTRREAERYINEIYW